MEKKAIHRENPLHQITRHLRDALADLRFDEPVAHTYQPLDYAWEAHAQYLSRFGEKRPREMLWLGMNPGPWGMTQTGIPFGHIPLVRDWMGIEAEIMPPAVIHPKRPIEGFACQREEVSGARLWGWAREKAPRAEDFFERIFLTSYCPLVFLEASGRNRTPDKLPAKEREALFAPCDEALRATIAYLQPRVLVAIGRFAEQRFKALDLEAALPILCIPHPSPASPLANAGWAEAVEKVLHEAAISCNFPSSCV